MVDHHELHAWGLPIAELNYYLYKSILRCSNRDKARQINHDGINIYNFDLSVSLVRLP